MSSLTADERKLVSEFLGALESYARDKAHNIPENTATKQKNKDKHFTNSAEHNERNKRAVGAAIKAAEEAQKQ